eukprot:11335967-Alexandrium_andersonii.AAC.1
MRMAAGILVAARVPTWSRRVFRPSSRARPCAVSRSAFCNCPGAGEYWGQKRGLRAKSLGLAP